MKTTAFVLALALAATHAFAPGMESRTSSTSLNSYLSSLEQGGAPVRSNYSPAAYAPAEAGGEMVHPASQPRITFGGLAGPHNGGVEGSSILPQQYQQVDAENPYGSNSGYNTRYTSPGNGGQTRVPRMREPLLPRVQAVQGDQVMTTGGIEGSGKIWSVYQGPNGSA